MEPPKTKLRITLLQIKFRSAAFKLIQGSDVIYHKIEKTIKFQFSNKVQDIPVSYEKLGVSVFNEIQNIYVHKSLLDPAFSHKNNFFISSMLIKILKISYVSLFYENKNLLHFMLSSQCLWWKER